VLVPRSKEPHIGSLKDPDVLLELVNRIAEGVYITNHNGDIIDANPAMVQILGFRSLEELRRTRVQDFVDGEMRAEELKLLLRDGSVRDFELLIKRPDGEVRWVLDSAYAAREANGAITYHGVLRDITIRKRLEGQLLEQSIRDPLTGAFNRRHLNEFERKLGDQPWGVLIFDIDHFKHYNDTYGHQAGDMVLIRMVRFLMRHVRADSSIVRMGGDEFVVLLPNATLEQTAKTAERIQLAAQKEAPAPFSMGTGHRVDAEPLEKTIHNADQHLYEVRTFLRTPNQERRKTQ
jgi:diguanylate cyclase (GGDEF)-like protein/PAS domain S-box-containing protein